MKANFVIDSGVNRLLVPVIEHKEMPDHDDCGLPESPIYANYTKYLWTSHIKTGGSSRISASPEQNRGVDQGKRTS